MSESRADSMPVSFPVMSSRALTQRRSVFSSDYMQLTSSHVMSIPEAMTAGARRSRRVPVIEDSLQLLDDLTNRPVDPLFEDATLLKSRTQRPALKVISKVVTFLMCVLVGLGTFLAIQELHKDTRQKVREELANQVSDTLTKSDNLDKDVTDLKSQVTALSNKLAGEATNDSLTEQDALANATSEVSGAGLEVALADPRESDSEKGSSPRDSSSNIVVVTDTDLQRIVSILWSGGAEAISVNGVRLGVQSSVRAAGDAILVGVSPIQTPYTVSAIGDKATLRQALQTAETKKFFATLESEGIYPSISEKSSIKLKAASQPEVMYSERKQ